MRIEDFPLAWRWTQSSHAVLPANVLASLIPLESTHTDQLYHRGEKVFSDISATSILQHHSEEFEATREWLVRLPFSANARVLIVWSRDTGISLPWHTFVAFWDDFCYPSSDDAFVFPESGSAGLAWNHYEVFQYVESAV
jgi:hypothetical protein